GIRDDDRRGRGPDAQRLPVGLLRACRLPRHPRRARAPVARHHDGATVGQGLSRRHHPPAPLLQPVLARPGHYLGRHFQPRLPARSILMSNNDTFEDEPPNHRDLAPGEELIAEHEPACGLRGYVLGFGLAVLLTAASFVAAQTDLIYQPAVISALVVLAIAQMGVHLVFFLHITTGPDNTNNVLALAFGVLIVALVVLGSIWIMANLNENLGHMSLHDAEMLP